MSEKLDLSGEIANAINAAATRGHTIAISYIDDDGFPAVSFAAASTSTTRASSRSGLADQATGSLVRSRTVRR